MNYISPYPYREGPLGGTHSIVGLVLRKPRASASPKGDGYDAAVKDLVERYAPGVVLKSGSSRSSLAAVLSLQFPAKQGSLPRGQILTLRTIP